MSCSLYQLGHLSVTGGQHEFLYWARAYRAAENEDAT